MVSEEGLQIKLAEQFGIKRTIRERDKLIVDHTDKNEAFSERCLFDIFRSVSRLISNSLAPSFGNNLYVNTHTPVSYTHLDVYKRQMLYCKTFLLNSEVVQD